MKNTSLKLPSFAKINSFLRILGKRPDGYHEVVTLLQTVSLCDDLTFQLRDDDKLILTLWKQSDGTFATDRPGLHHLSFEVDSLEAVKAAEARVRDAGLRLYHDGIVPHGEGASSGGIFFEDPDGIRLEIFTGAGVHGTAPSGAAPTCGFF